MKRTECNFEIKKYIEDLHSESIVDVLFNKKDGYIMLKFVFEYDTFYGTAKTDITIHDFSSDVIVQYYSSKNAVLQYKIDKLCKVIIDEVIPKWFPELYLAFSFKNIKYQG